MSQVREELLSLMRVKLEDVRATHPDLPFDEMFAVLEQWAKSAPMITVPPLQALRRVGSFPHESSTQSLP